MNPEVSDMRQELYHLTILAGTEETEKCFIELHCKLMILQEIGW